ncbi:MAG: protein BatD [Chitinophagales bacterium]|nr:protein BatD [Chitinophagales bacterium]
MENSLKKAYLLTFLLVCCCCSANLFAQAKFYASANKQVPVNQHFQVNFTLENGETRGFKPPVFNDFQVLSGPNTSQSMSYINGSLSSSVTYSFILRPKKEGSFKIGKASVNVGGANLESNELSIEVTKAVQQQAQQQQRRGFNPFGFPDPFEDDPFFSDPFEQQEAEPTTPATNEADVQKDIKKNTLLRIVLSDNSVYQGEQLTATLRLYFSYSLGNLQLTKAMGLEGFWNQEIQIDPNLRPRVEEYNGKKYHVVDIQKYTLFPQRSGTLKLSAAEISAVAQVQVRSNRRSMWSMFGMDIQNVPFKLTSNEASVQVKELPTAEKPASFNGAVGEYTFSTKLSAPATKTDEPVTLSAIVSGKGNIKFVDLNKPQLPDGFEVYDPKLKESITNNEGGFSGSKQYDFLIIPRQPGNYKIPATEFSFFNPKTQKYTILKSQEFSLNVTGEPSGTTTAVLPSVTAKSGVSSLGQDIRYIKTSMPNYEADKKLFPASVGFGAAFASPLFLLVALVFVKRRNSALGKDIIGTKRRKALSVARKRLATADKHEKQGSKKEFYDEVSRATWGYLADKLSIEMSALNKENVGEKLTAKNVKPATQQHLNKLLHTCEIALYAPVSEVGEMRENYTDALNLIADLEDEIKG